MNREKFLGIAGGIGSVLYTSCLFLLDKSLIFQPIWFWLGIIFWVLPMIPAALSPQSTIYESSMRNRLRSAFLVFVIASFIYDLFYWMLFNLIDVDLHLTLYEVSIQRTGDSLRLNAIGSATNPDDFRLSIGKTLFSFGRSLIGGFLIATVISFITDRYS